MVKCDIQKYNHGRYEFYQLMLGAEGLASVKAVNTVYH